MPAGHDVSRFRSGIFFFFIVVTNVHINLCIKLCPHLVRIYCSDCLQLKLPNRNLLFRHISRGRGPTHHFLCDFQSSFDLFIKTRLNSSLSQKGSTVLIVLNKSGPIKLHYPRVYHKGGGGGGGEPTHLYLCDVKANHHLEKLFSFNGGHMSEFTTPDLPFSERNQTFFER